jgi:hypothetical protein
MCAGCDVECAYWLRQDTEQCVQEARESGVRVGITTYEDATYIARCGNEEAVGDECFTVEPDSVNRGCWAVRHHARFYALT